MSKHTLLIVAAAFLCGCRPGAGPAPFPSTSTSELPPLPTQIVGAAEWIEVDLAAQVVLLHRDGEVIARLAAASGLPAYDQYRTPTGVFDIHVKQKGPIENVPGVYVSDILIFDLEKGIGFHSRPMDADGRWLDERLGLPITGGCVRVGESAQLYDFAEIGMWVWIHGGGGDR